MDKERLEELKLRVSDAEAYSDMVLVAPSTVGELIAEVEFLTKVAEQAVEIGALGQYDCSGQPYITSRYIGSGRGQQCHEASEDYPELAQYLKMGKE
jgi:hypothetical protein